MWEPKHRCGERGDLLGRPGAKEPGLLTSGFHVAVAEPVLLLVGEEVGAGVQGPPCGVQRVALAVSGV